LQKIKIDFDSSNENCTLGLEKSKEMKQYIVDAFTNEPFSGNPAAVCVMDHWPPEKSMMKLAMENNLSETAFIVKEEKLPFKMVHTGNGSGIMRACNTGFCFCDPELL